MRTVIFGFLIVSLLYNCNPKDEAIPQYTFKGQFINATENTVPIGLKISLEASSGPNTLDFKTEVLGTAVTDSMGRFSISYTKTKLPLLRLLSQFYTYNNLPINQNLDTIFYRSTKGILVLNLISDLPLGVYDTLYLPWINNFGAIEKLSGPIPKNHFISYRIKKLNSDFYEPWGINYPQYDSVNKYPNKFPENFLNIDMKGDPFIDTVIFKYR